MDDRLKNIVNLKNYIYKECQEYLYSSEKCYNVFKNIINASRNILLNAKFVVANIEPEVKISKNILTVENSEKLLFEMYCIATELDFVTNKEIKIKKLLSKYGLLEEELFRE